ncbi:MAG: hypothetical protein HKN81_02410 [Gammaproteobacteria bacterium]|nr:hypothetical protein [Gammaproteobacteria bacterium]
MPAHAADDLAALFDDNFKGIELALPSADEMLAKRPTAAEFAAARLPGMLLSTDDLSLVLRITDPVGSTIPGDARDIERETIRQRFVKWITQRSDKSEQLNVFSALIRTPDETGMRVDFDVDTEEVRVEYRVGF